MSAQRATESGFHRPATAQEKREAYHRRKRKQASRQQTPEANRARNYEALANKEGSKASNRIARNRATTARKARPERGRDMHCTHEGHEAENGHAAQKKGQRPEKRVTAPPTLHMDNGKGPEKGHKAEKSGNDQLPQS